MNVRGELTELKPIAGGDRFEIPGIGSLIRGGFPNPADDFFREAINIGDVLIKNPDSTYYGHAFSDSMETLIYEGAIILIDKSLDIPNGKYGVFELDGDLLMKRYWEEGGIVTLHSENPLYDPIIVREYMTFRKIGRIISAIQLL